MHGLEYTCTIESKRGYFCFKNVKIFEKLSTAYNPSENEGKS